MGLLDDLDNREIGFPDPDAFRNPYSDVARSTVAGHSWIVTHSTRSKFWQGKCNAKVLISESMDNGAIYAYEDLDCHEVRSVALETQRWGVVGRGKVGKLAGWMRETPHGIEDKAGEVRADWRATWAVLIVNDAQGRLEGMDLLASTLYNSNGIADALRAVCMQETSKVVFRLEDVVEVKSRTTRECKNQSAPVAQDSSAKTRKDVKTEERYSIESTDIREKGDPKEEKSRCCVVM